MNIRNLSKYPNLYRYFYSYLNRQHTFNWRDFPIVLRWVDKGGNLLPALNIVDSKLGYLYKQGATSKIKEWFNTKNVYGEVTIYAERYILDYLKKNNPNLIENFKGGGVDAMSGKIGIEVTIFNETQVIWVFQERLLMYLFLNKIMLNHAYEIRYQFENLKNFKYSKPKDILDTVELVGKKISNLENSKKRIFSNEIYEIEKLKKGHHYISWNFPFSNKTNRNLVDFLLDATNKSLSGKKKQKQFSENTENIVFICVNFISETNFYPDNTTFFREFYHPKRYRNETKELELKISAILPNNVSGVCFFEYSIDKEHPFYKLKILPSKCKTNKKIKV